MTGTLIRTRTTKILLSMKLEILRFISDGYNLAHVARKFETDCESVKRIFDLRGRLEKESMNPNSAIIIKMNSKASHR